jgi:hypothetical protein
MITCEVGVYDIWSRLSEDIMREGFLALASMGQRERAKEGGAG